MRTLILQYTLKRVSYTFPHFSKVLKGIPCRFSYSIANEHVDEKDFHEKVLYKKRGDADDRLRDSYNQVIREKLQLHELKQLKAHIYNY